MTPKINQIGRLVFEGQLATKFWIRALDLQEDVEYAKKLMLEKSERKWCAVPIIAEYQIDPQLTIVYLIVAQVDALGVQGGTGVIYYASPDRLPTVLKERDRQADDILKNLETGFDEIVTMEDKNEKTRDD